MDAKLAVARVRPARTEEDIDRALEFLRTPRVREVMEGHPEERGCVRLCESNGEIIGALLIDPSSICLRDTLVRCARLCETGGEDGRIRFRKTGRSDLFEFLIEEFLGYVWARRYPVAYVHGELALYPEQAFVPCFFHPRVTVPVAAALHLPAPYRVRHLKSDDVRAISELRTRFRRLKPVVFAAGVPIFHHFCIEGHERNIQGCFSLEVDADARWNPAFFAPEVDVADRAAACTLLRHCAQKAEQAGLDTMHFPVVPGHPVANLCLELGGRSTIRGPSTDLCHNEEMIHLADPARLGGAFSRYFALRLERLGAQSLRMRIPIATDRGAWAIEVEEGGARITAIDREQEVCVEMPHWKLTQLLTGFRGTDELDMDLLPEQREMLKLLLPKTWPYSMSDADHWQERRNPMPYAKQALSRVHRTKLPWVQNGTEG